VRAHRDVEPPQRLLGRVVVERAGAQRVAGERGDGGRLRALAGDVADHHRPLLRRAREDVVEVPADLVELARRAVAGGQHGAGDLGQPRRQQARLQRVGDVGALGVEARVVDRGGRAPGELLGELDVDLLEQPARAELASVSVPNVRVRARSGAMMIERRSSLRTSASWSGSGKPATSISSVISGTNSVTPLRATRIEPVSWLRSGGIAALELLAQPPLLGVDVGGGDLLQHAARRAR
jgi:hypothetical protein